MKCINTRPNNELKMDFETFIVLLSAKLLQLRLVFIDNSWAEVIITIP